MATDGAWLLIDGPRLTDLLETRRDAICAATAHQLSKTFPNLCLDRSRPDAATFQQTVFQQTPLRFHRLILLGLRIRSLEVIEREYRWLWSLLPRYGVEQKHMLALAGWYFNAARMGLARNTAEWQSVAEYKRVILRVITDASSVRPAARPPLLLTQMTMGAANED